MGREKPKGGSRGRRKSRSGQLEIQGRQCPRKEAPPEHDKIKYSKGREMPAGLDCPGEGGYMGGGEVAGRQRPAEEELAVRQCRQHNALAGRPGRKREAVGLTKGSTGSTVVAGRTAFTS